MKLLICLRAPSSNSAAGLMRTMRPIPALVLAMLIGTGLLWNVQAQTGAAAAAPADAVPPPSAPAQRSPAELEKLVAPIALHPDPLIAVVLPASVYPLEIVQAARFVKDTNNIPKVDEQEWDENVKAVAKFPEMIAKMDADLPWTVELGQAFLDQRKDVMDMIQTLRSKAHKAGTLQNNPQQVVVVTNVVVMQTNVTQVVTVTNQVVQVQPSNPEVIYVPSYPPTVYYPPPAYVYNPVAPLVTFGVGMAWGAVLANNCDWGHGDVDIDIDHNVNVDRNVNRNTDRTRTSTSSSGKQKWQPDQSRLNKSGAPSASTQNRDARGWGGSGASQRPTSAASGRTSNFSSPNAGTRPSTGASAGTAQRSGASGASSRPTSNFQSPSGNRPSPSASSSGSRPSPSASQRSGGAQGSAFSGVSSGGGGARSASSRGGASRGGGGGRGGGGRR